MENHLAVALDEECPGDAEVGRRGHEAVDSRGVAAAEDAVRFGGPGSRCRTRQERDESDRNQSAIHGRSWMTADREGLNRYFSSVSVRDRVPSHVVSCA